MSFKVLGIEHVAIAFDDLDAPADFFGRLLGIKNTSTEEVKDQKVITDIFDTKSGKVELLKATADDSPIAKFLETKGPGVHHIAFRVDDINLALKELSDEGIQLIDKSPRIGAEGMLIAFLHPKSTNGILVEICQEP